MHLSEGLTFMFSIFFLPSLGNCKTRRDDSGVRGTDLFARGLTLERGAGVGAPHGRRASTPLAGVCA